MLILFPVTSFFHFSLNLRPFLLPLASFTSCSVCTVAMDEEAAVFIELETSMIKCTFARAQWIQRNKQSFEVNSRCDRTLIFMLVNDCLNRMQAAQLSIAKNYTHNVVMIKFDHLSFKFISLICLVLCEYFPSHSNFSKLC